MFYVFAIWVMASNVLKGEKGPTVEGPTKKEKEKRSRREKNQEKKEKLAMMKKAKKEKGKGKGKGVWMGMGRAALSRPSSEPVANLRTQSHRGTATLRSTLTRTPPAAVQPANRRVFLGGGLLEVR